MIILNLVCTFYTCDFSNQKVPFVSPLFSIDSTISDLLWSLPLALITLNGYMVLFLIRIKRKTQSSQMLAIHRKEMDGRHGRPPQMSFTWCRWEMSLEVLINAHSKIEAFWKFWGHFLIICFQYINLQFLHHFHEVLRVPWLWRFS